MDLLERDTILAELSRLLADAATGNGRLAFVSGEAGAGKTVLARRFAQDAAGLADVMLGSCDPLTTPRPLGPLLDIAVGGSIPSVAQLIDADALRERVFKELLTTLSNRRRPALVIVEDAHWADEATLDLLRYLGRRIEVCRALLVVTYRDDEVGTTHPLRVVMGDLSTSDRVTRIPVPPLSEAAVALLVAESGIDPHLLFQLTGGNPFFVTEVLAAGGAVPPTVRDAVLARAARLSDAARETLAAASAIGARIDPELLLAITEGGVQPLDECIAAGVLSSDHGALLFRHEIAREAVYAGIPVHRRARLHAAILATLESTPDTPDDDARRAHHAELAGDVPAVLRYAPAAGRRAANLGAHREAAAQYARALRFSDRLPPAEHIDLLASFSEQAMVLDHLDEGIAARERATTLSREIGDVRREALQQERVSRMLFLAGRNVDGERAIANALALLEGQHASPEACQAWASYAYARMLNRDTADAVEWGSRAIELAQQFDDRETEVRAANAVGSALICAGDLAGITYLERSVALAIADDLDDHAANGYSNLGSALGEIYQLNLAEGYLEQTVAWSLDHELDGQVSYARAWQVLVWLYQGRWVWATEQALELLALPQSSTITRIMALIALGRVRARRGDPDGALVLDQALALAGPTGTLQRIAPVRAARAEAAWLAGDRDRAGTEARAAWEMASAHRHAWFAGELAYWRRLAGDDAEAADWMAEPFRLQLQGRANAAAQAWETLGCPYEAARALADSEDEADLRHALETFERLGARPSAATTARRLREIGARGIPRGPRPSTRSTPGLLTRREVDVVRLAAEGLRNAEIAERLFVTAKTVDHHLSSAMGKLGVHSRHEAAREAGRLGLLDKSGEPPAPT